MAFTLPGGIWREGQRARAAALQPLTGRIEQALGAELERAASWPEAVSRMLAVCVESVGGVPCSSDLVEDMCVADRSYLMLGLARELDGDDFWNSARCPACRAWFDLPLRRSALPVKSGGPGFPFAELELGGRRVRARVPTGADQRFVLELAETDAVRALVARCLVAVDGVAPAPEFAAMLDDDDIERIEAAVDDVAADVGTAVVTGCPECGGEVIANIDPFALGRVRSGHLFREVHVLAGRYHWSEAEILSLPRARRHLYLTLIEEEHGVQH